MFSSAKFMQATGNFLNEKWFSLKCKPHLALLGGASCVCRRFVTARKLNSRPHSSHKRDNRRIVRRCTLQTVGAQGFSPTLVCPQANPISATAFRGWSPCEKRAFFSLSLSNLSWENFHATPFYSERESILRGAAANPSVSALNK